VGKQHPKLQSLQETANILTSPSALVNSQPRSIRLGWWRHCWRSLGWTSTTTRTIAPSLICLHSLRFWRGLHLSDSSLTVWQVQASPEYSHHFFSKLLPTAVSLPSTALNGDCSCEDCWWSVSSDGPWSPSDCRWQVSNEWITRERPCPEVIYVRPTVNTVFIDKHGCSSDLMLYPHRLEQSSLIVRTADSFTSFRSQLKTYTC